MEVLTSQDGSASKEGTHKSSRKKYTQYKNTKKYTYFYFIHNIFSIKMGIKLHKERNNKLYF